MCSYHEGTWDTYETSDLLGRAGFVRRTRRRVLNRAFGARSRPHPPAIPHSSTETHRQSRARQTHAPRNAIPLTRTRHTRMKPGVLEACGRRENPDCKRRYQPFPVLGSLIQRISGIRALIRPTIRPSAGTWLAVCRSLRLPSKRPAGSFRPARSDRVRRTWTASSSW